MIKTPRYLLGLLVLCATVALAATLKVDSTKSAVSATFRQMGVPVEAKFNRFSAQIDYDSAKPENAKASVDIEVASFDLGDPDYNSEVRKKEWFHAAQFPKASFASTTPLRERTVSKHGADQSLVILPCRGEFAR